MKYLLIISFIFQSFISFSQTKIGFGFQNPKESINYLTETEKLLLTDCVNILGTSIDSLHGVSEIYNTPDFYNSNIRAVVRSSYLFTDPISKNLTYTVTETQEYRSIFRKPKYMIFIVREDKGSKVTLQMYY
jgi:hypothetical protein